LLTGRRTPPTVLPPAGPVPPAAQATLAHPPRSRRLGLIITAAVAVAVGLAVTAYALSQRDRSNSAADKQPTSQPASRPAVQATPADWETDATEFRGRNGQKFTFACGGNGKTDGIWGTGLYTDDSSICTAAVHSGLITMSKGGTVTIEIAPGAASYTGSAQGGVTSADYGAWGGSFKFVS